MFGILARVLEILYSVWPNYGGSIILFTIVIMLVLAPLTFKSTRSMLAMQALQPEMKKLQNRYKDDRQKLNEEMMKFYQENKISPLGGCLPMLIQFPVFIILYRVLLGLTERGPFGADLGHSMACSMGGSNTCTTIGTYANAGFFHPSYLTHSSRLYQDLSATRVMQSFGLDLSQSAWGQIAGGLLHALPYLVMVLIVMGLTYLQQQQIQSRQPKTAEQNPTQQMMMKVMPVAMGFIYIIIPAGVVVYFLVSSVFRIGQQAMVTRTFYNGPNAIITTTGTEAGSEPVEKKRFWEQFKPSSASLPQVSKQARQDRAESFRSNGSKAKGPSGDGGGARSGSSGSKSSKNAGRSSGSAARSGGKSNTKPGAKQAGAKKAKAGAPSSRGGSSGKPSSKAPSAKKKQATRPTNGAKADSEKRTGKTEDKAGPTPSRKAPSRKAPKGPAGSRKNV